MFFINTLPDEAWQHIAFLLAALTPLGPPSALTPLLLTSKGIARAVDDPDLRARIFRLKFDVSAPTRRLGHPPTSSAQAAQLVHYCLALRVLRAGDPSHIDTPYALRIALLAMLDNDGKNYAQLTSYAHIHLFLRRYLHTRLWLESDLHENDGWPRESNESCAALWLMWMTTERGHLLNESIEERERVIELILPFVVMPQRYAASDAPPNHFRMPMKIPLVSCTTTTTTTTNTTRVSTSTYPHYLPPRAVSAPYFGLSFSFHPSESSTPSPSPSPSPSHSTLPLLSITLPIASIPAKLLFIARRELRPVVIPAHVPPGPGAPGQPLTRDDYHELNRAKAALLPRNALWDWDMASGRSVNPILVYVRQGDREREVESELVWIVGDGEESRRWDTVFWRMVLCGDYRALRMGISFRPGEVYTLGSMGGKWRGKIYIPQATQFNLALHNPIYPSVNDELAAEHGQVAFTEKSLRLVMQPVYLEVKEHHRVCLCADEREICEGDEEDQEEGEEEEEYGHGCGIIPVPEPQVVVLNRAPSHPLALHQAQPQPPAPMPMHQQQQQQVQQQVQYHHHQHTQVVPLLHPSTQNSTSPLVNPQIPQFQSQNAYTPLDPSTQSPVPEPSTSASASASASASIPVYKAFPPSPHQLQQQVEAHLDMGMCNAWFGGSVGGVSWVSRVSPRAGGSGSGGGVGEGEKEGRGMRDQVVFGLNYTPPDSRVRDGDAYCVGISDAFVPSFSSSSSSGSSSTATSSSSSSADSTTASKETGPKKKDKDKKKEKRSFVYETYDPSKMSTHDALFPHTCTGVDVGVNSDRNKNKDEDNHPPPPSVSLEGENQNQNQNQNVSSYETQNVNDRRETQSQSQNEFNNENPTTKFPLAHRFIRTPTCSTCEALDRARLEAKKAREDEEATSVLERLMSSVSSGSGSGSGSGNDEDEDEEMQMDELDDLDMAAFGAEEVVRGVERGVRAHLHVRSSGGDEDVDMDEDDDEEEEEDDEDEDKDEDDVQSQDDDEEGGDNDSDTTELSTGSRKRKRSGLPTPAPGSLSPFHGEGVVPTSSSGGRGSRKRLRRQERHHGHQKRRSGSGAPPRSSSASAAHFDDTQNDTAHTGPTQTQMQMQTHAHPNTHINHTHHTHSHTHTHTQTHVPAPSPPPCRGVKDIVLTGDTGSTFRIYQAFTCYGRVRRWDGLVGILRVSRGGPDGGISYLFIFGYVVGERTFVGEWRMAASDPLRPTWGSAFVMSKS